MKLFSTLAVLSTLVSSAVSLICDADKKELKLTVKLDLAVDYDNLFQVVDWCNKELIFEKTQGFLKAGKYEFPFCLSAIGKYEITFIDWKGEEKVEDGVQPDSYSVTFGSKEVVIETELYHDEQVTHVFGVGCPTDTPFSTGDPHFKTWSGKEFDFHGQCDMVLMSHPDFNDGEGMEIQIRTKARYQYSFIETAAIRIGTDIFELSGFGEHAYNGVEGAEFPVTLGHTAVVNKIEVTDKSATFEVNLMDGTRVMLKSFKDMVSVTMDRDVAGNMKNVQGVLGSSATYDMQARDGTLMTDPDAFGMEWQVRDTDPKLFTNQDRAPQWPQQCVMPEISTEEKRRLGESSVSREDAKKACEEAGRKADMDGCIFDVIATGDLEMAMAGF